MYRACVTANHHHARKSASARPSSTHSDTLHARSTACAEQHTSVAAARVAYVCDLVYTYKIINRFFSHFFKEAAWGLSGTDPSQMGLSRDIPKAATGSVPGQTLLRWVCPGQTPSSFLKQMRKQTIYDCVCIHSVARIRYASCCQTRVLLGGCSRPRMERVEVCAARPCAR